MQLIKPLRFADAPPRLPRKRMPAPARELPLKPPFSKMCRCGAAFTEASPIYCEGCCTFTHTVYWLGFI